MARGKRSRRRLRQWQRDAAAMAFALFPMLAMAGLFSPAVVQVQEDLEEVLPRPRVVQLADASHYRLLIPPDFLDMPGLLDMDRMFQNSGTSANISRRYMLPFGRSHSDSIVIGDVAKSPLPAFLFKDPLGLTSSFGLVAIEGFSDEMLIDDERPYEHYHQKRGGRWGDRLRKDEPGVTPEPGTALLLGSGLVVLALRRRPQRAPIQAPRGYFQPMG